MSDPTGPLVLHFDDLFNSAEGLRQLKSVLGDRPVSQLEAELSERHFAAAMEADSLHTRLAQRRKQGEPVGASSSEVPAWFRLGMLSAWVKFVTGRARTCTHNPTPWNPQPILASAWQPDLVTCMLCTHLHTVASPEADLTCDACGHVCDPVPIGYGIYTQVVRFGALLYQAGMCEDCKFGPEE